MSMKEYRARVQFTLSLIQDPAYSVGLTVKPGEIILYDGKNVEYNGIKDVSLTLSAAIREGWLVESSDLEKESPTTPKETQGTLIEEANPVVAQTRDATGKKEQEPLVTSEGTSTKRGLKVEMNDTRVLKEASHKMEEQKSLNTESPRNKLPIISSDNEDIIVGKVSSSREERASDISMNEGDITFTGKTATTSSEKTDVTEGSVTITSENTDIIIEPSRRTPAKSYNTFDEGVTTSEESEIVIKSRRSTPTKSDFNAEDAPMTPQGAENQVYDAASIDAGALEDSVKQDTGSMPKVLESSEGRVKKASEALKEQEGKPEVTKIEVASDKPKVVSIESSDWKSLTLDGKIEAVTKINDIETLEGIRVSKKSHWKVKRAAKERLGALASV